MELRELRYFLAVAREQNISRAAEYLYITQPSLTRQMQKLEQEVGQPLFHRGRTITLTETGVLLRKRAQELLELYEKAEAELSAPAGTVAGDIHIGGGETYAFRPVLKIAKELQNQYPDVTFHLTSGDYGDVTERLDKGLIDFGVLIEPADVSKYDSIRLPLKEEWGVLLRKDHPLARKQTITPGDLSGIALIRSRQTLREKENMIDQWLGSCAQTIRLTATYNLIYNASLMVEEGMGCVLGLNRIINTSGSSELVFRPLEPKLESSLVIVWKKYQVFSRAAERFLRAMQAAFHNRK